MKYDEKNKRCYISKTELKRIKILINRLVKMNNANIFQTANKEHQIQSHLGDLYVINPFTDTISDLANVFSCILNNKEIK